MYIHIYTEVKYIFSPKCMTKTIVFLLVFSLGTKTGEPHNFSDL